MATSTTIIGLHCGDEVQLREDSRHCGNVIAIINGVVRVRWQGTTWISDEKPENLKRIPT